MMKCLKGAPFKMESFVLMKLTMLQPIGYEQSKPFANEIDFLRNVTQSQPQRVEQFALFLEEKQIFALSREN